jgi:hypothetical protein
VSASKIVDWYWDRPAYQTAAGESAGDAADTTDMYFRKANVKDDPLYQDTGPEPEQPRDDTLESDLVATVRLLRLDGEALNPLSENDLI